MPSTFTPGNPYAAAFAAKSVDAVCMLTGVEYANWLFSITKTTRQRQRACHVQRLVKVRSGCRPVSAECEAHPILAAVLGGEGHSGRDGKVRRNVAGQVVDAQVEPTVVQRAVAAAGRRGGLAHEAGHHLPRFHPPAQMRTEVAMDRRHVVAVAQRGRGPDGDRLVPVPGIQASRADRRSCTSRPCGPRPPWSAPSSRRCAPAPLGSRPDSAPSADCGLDSVEVAIVTPASDFDRNSSRLRLKSAFRSIIDQCPQCE